MLNEVKKALIEHNMLSHGDRCILAVSGGADSMGLLCALLKLRAFFSVDYRVVHVNHGIRGKEAERDAEFVKHYCEVSDVPCRIVSVDVPAYVKENGMSLEEAARYLRYQVLETEASDWDAEVGSESGTDIAPCRIAVAHNKEDNAETILMQLIRGSGLKGISGIQYKRDRIIRPLLDISRKDIEGYLKEENIGWITDSTNEETEYTRNKIRHLIMPLAEEINPGAVDCITRAGKTAGQAEDYIYQNARSLLEKAVIREKDCCAVPVSIFDSQPEIIRTYIIRQMLMEISKSMKDITAKHIGDIEGLIDAETGKRIVLPYKLEAERCYDIIKIFRKGLHFRVKEESNLSDSFIFRKIPYNGEKVPESKYTKWFDYNKIGEWAEVRFRKTGDYIRLGKVGKKSLNAYLTDEKIPKEIRPEIPLVAAGSHIVWIVGYRISEEYKVGPDTKTVLEITYKKET